MYGSHIDNFPVNEKLNQGAWDESAVEGRELELYKRNSE